MCSPYVVDVGKVLQEVARKWKLAHMRTMVEDMHGMCAQWYRTCVTRKHHFVYSRHSTHGRSCATTVQLNADLTSDSYCWPNDTATMLAKAIRSVE